MMSVAESLLVIWLSTDEPITIVILIAIPSVAREEIVIDHDERHMCHEILRRFGIDERQQQR